MSHFFISDLKKYMILLSKLILKHNLSFKINIATAICGWQPREQNWSCCLGGKDALFPFQSHWASHELIYVKKKEQISLKCVSVPCDAAGVSVSEEAYDSLYVIGESWWWESADD